MLVEYSIDGYEIMERNITNDREGRGLIIYIRKDISVTEITMEQQQYCEYICIELKGSVEQILVASIYRSPSNDMTENERLLKLMQELTNHQAKY